MVKSSPLVAAFLQNAWFKPTTRQEHIQRYQSDPTFRSVVLAMSRTGKRLISNLGDDLYGSISWENASPKTGFHSGSRFKADLNHIRERLLEVRPKIVVACGEEAEDALKRAWGSPLIVIPHPAYRVVTNDLFKELRRILIEQLDKSRPDKFRMAIRQRKGKFELEDLMVA